MAGDIVFCSVDGNCSCVLCKAKVVICWYMYCVYMYVICPYKKLE